MNIVIFIVGLLASVYTVTAMPRYLIIPLDEVELIQLSPGFSSEPSLVRVARRAETFVPVALDAVHTEEVDPPTPRIERATTHLLDYVDFGGHTGENGAFGWYADFPAHQ